MAEAFDGVAAPQLVRERCAQVARAAQLLPRRFDARRRTAVARAFERARPATTMPYVEPPAEATQRAVNVETLSS